jgi:hypothetical protein
MVFFGLVLGRIMPGYEDYPDANLERMLEAMPYLLRGTAEEAVARFDAWPRRGAYADLSTVDAIGAYLDDNYGEATIQRLIDDVWEVDQSQRVDLYPYMFTLIVALVRSGDLVFTDAHYSFFGRR